MDINILISMYDDIKRAKLRDFISRFENFTVYQTKSFKESIEFLQENQVDIVISSFFLEDKDSINLLSKVKDIWPKTKYIFYSELNQVEVGIKMMNLGADFYMRDSSDLYSLKKVIDLLLYKNPKIMTSLFTNIKMDLSTIDEKDLKLFDFLEECGIRSESKSFEYIAECLKLIDKDATLLNSITKLLYPKVSKELNISEAAIEKSIRSCINNLYNDTGNQKFKEKFSISDRINFRKPTNREFLFKLFEMMRIF